jgi:hypothetical protein
MASRTDERPPWKRKNPKKTHATLTPEQRGEARARARTAGRRYPNLVDNMAVARNQPKRASTSKTKGVSKSRKHKKSRASTPRASKPATD